MNRSDKNLFHKHFSHIYVEEGAENYPDARSLMDRFPAAVRVPIRNYKEVFNRPGQSFQFQKQAMKLILAVKKDHFLYPGSTQTPSFGHGRFFYNSMILNCVYNCDYCYLQGMYPSANVVFFVNGDDFLTATDKSLAQGPLYLCISYDTDLLAFESFLPQCRRWIEFARSRPTLTVEIRTKSSNYNALRDLKPASNVILAWTLSPQVITDQFESGTPSLQRRLEAASEAIRDGWPVRLCWDPILKIDGWRDIYGKAVRETADQLNTGSLHDVSLGVFRMNKHYLKTIRAQRQDSAILYSDWDESGQTCSYPESDRVEMIDHLKRLWSHYVPSEKIFV